MKPKQILAIVAATWLVAAGVVLYAQPAAALECSMLPTSICAGAENNSSLETSSIWVLLIFGLNILTAGVGIVAVGAIAYAGFLYTTAQSNAEQTKKAIEMIRNTAIGLLLFAGMFAIVNFLVPGGAFSGGSIPPGGGGGGGSQPAPKPVCPPSDPVCAV